MTNIHFLIETIWRNQSRCSYLRNKKIVVTFFLPSWNLDQTLNISKEKRDSHTLCISGIPHSEKPG